MKLKNIKNSSVFLRVVNGSLIQPKGEIDLHVTVADKTIKLTFVIVNHFPHDVLLGLDFCTQSEAEINFRTKNLTVLDSIFPISLDFFAEKDKFARCGRATTIPPCSELPLNVSALVNSCYLLEPNPHLFQKFGIFACKTLTNFENRSGYIRVCNPTKRSITLPPGIKIAKLYEVVNVQFLKEENSQDYHEEQNHHIKETEINFGEKLNKEQKTKIVNLLQKYSRVISKHPTDLGKTHLFKHRIDTADHLPIRQQPYRKSLKEREIIKKEVDKLLDANIIRESTSPWAAPVILVRKKDGNWRFCVDWRKLNKVTKKDVHPLPRIDDTLDRLADALYFTSLDFTSGFFQVEIEEEDKEKTAFVTPDGHYEFNVLGMGLCNSPSTFQRLMYKALRGLMWTVCMAYMDDIIIFSKDFESHLSHIEQVLEQLEKANLKIKPQKCTFATHRLLFLGHIVDGHGVSPNPELLKAVHDFPEPKTVKQVQAFLGLTGYYRRFIENYSNIAKPLSQLTKADVKFEFAEEERKSFETLKSKLLSFPILAHPRFHLPFEVHTDASAYGIGAILKQVIVGKEHVIAYASRLLNKAERNYSATHRECLAIIFALQKFRPYIYGQKFRVVTDHCALCWLLSVKNPNGRLARWALQLQEFDMEVVYKSGRKHRDADALSRVPVEPAPDSETELPLMVTENVDMWSLQREDKFIKNMIDILEGKCEKPDRSTRRTARCFEMKDGILYRKKWSNNEMKLTLVLPRSLRKDVLFALHDDVTSGHLGLTKTWEKIKARFYWPKMFSHVVNYVKSCHSCNAQKHPTTKPSGLLQPIPPTLQPFQKIGIDKLGPFPTSLDGNKHIIVCTDYCTRMAVAGAINNGTAEEVANFFVNKLVLNFGAPQEIITDRGTEFVNKLSTEITKLLSIKHNRTTSYHPRTNGLTERFNKTVADMISHYVSADHKDWDRFLPHVLFAYNTSVHDVTGMTPYFLLFGYEPTLPIDAALNLPVNQIEHPFSLQNIHYAQEARKLANLKIQQSQLKNKERFDKKRKEIRFEPGDLVYISKPYRKPGLSEKLLHQFSGPYTVIRETAPNNYEVENNKGKSDIVSVERMKPYVSRIEEPDVPAKIVTFSDKVIIIEDTTDKPENTSLPEDGIQEEEKNLRRSRREKRTPQRLLYK